jgi:hypothetical protein
VIGDRSYTDLKKNSSTNGQKKKQEY